MIDRQRLGCYLKELRKNKKREKDGKPFSQEDLANVFMDEGMDVSVSAIADWENGNTLPTYEKLILLSKIYNKSIDEILDGEEKKEVDYSKKYFIYSKTINKNEDYWPKKNEQIKLITSRFKELILTRINREFTINEDQECKYLFETYYKLTEYAMEKAAINSDDLYMNFKAAIRNVLGETKDILEQEIIFWEVQKFYSEKKEIWFKFGYDVLEMRKNKIMKERFELIEDWQKDMLLAMFQNIVPIDIDNVENNSSLYLKYFEQINGEYNYETLIKNMIKDLINNGACINKNFLNVNKKYCEEKRIIERLEELYNMCLKPIEIYTNENNKIKKFKIENNCKNRFLKMYYFTIHYELNGYKTDFSDIDELYQWFINTKELTEKDYLRIAKNKSIDINREKKYWLADVKSFSKCFIESFEKFKRKEKEIEAGLIEIEELKSKLMNGQKMYRIELYRTIGGKDEDTIREYIEYWKSQLEYNEFLSQRKKSLTKKLLKDLDVLSFKQIREKYFKEEVYENE